jgi:hypothetical protein
MIEYSYNISFPSIKKMLSYPFFSTARLRFNEHYNVLARACVHILHPSIAIKTIDLHISIRIYRLAEACSTSSNAAAPIPVPTLK